MITYKILPDGAFVAGDTETRATAYAYPSSPRAERAKRFPEREASAMIAEQAWRVAQGYAQVHSPRHYDAANWRKLEGAP